MNATLVNRATSLARFRLPKRADQVLSWVGIAMVAALVGMLVFVALAPRLIGWHFVVVAGGSMEPTLHFESVAVMTDVKKAEIKAGDIVEFEDPAKPGRTVTHRVTQVSDDGALLTTKGDANNVEDQAPVPLDAVKARYMFSVPAVGRFIRWMGTRDGYMTVILVPGLAIVALELWSISQNLRKLRTGQKADAEAALAAAGGAPPSAAEPEEQSSPTADPHKARWKSNWTVGPRARR
jgi:signal peptidase